MSMLTLLGLSLASPHTWKHLEKRMQQKAREAQEERGAVAFPELYSL
jgi:hypothetical protein